MHLKAPGPREKWQTWDTQELGQLMSPETEAMQFQKVNYSKQRQQTTTCWVITIITLLHSSPVPSPGWHGCFSFWPCTPCSSSPCKLLLCIVQTRFSYLNTLVCQKFLSGESTRVAENVWDGDYSNGRALVIMCRHAHVQLFYQFLKIWVIQTSWAIKLSHVFLKFGFGRGLFSTIRDCRIRFISGSITSDRDQQGFIKL